MNIFVLVTDRRQAERLIMQKIRSICVYCGSSSGLLPEYQTAAMELGCILANESIQLIYGGSSIGIMRILADQVLARGGKVTGVIPEAIASRVAHPSLTELHITPTMHARKQLMFDLSDAFIALPGGMGTLDEIFEMITWFQLGLHGKPCAFLNSAGYFNLLFQFLDHAVQQRFIKSEHRDMIYVSESASSIIDSFRSHTSGVSDKWIGT
jgi:uncharacterized protein (TIGR00730 family)